MRPKEPESDYLSSAKGYFPSECSGYRFVWREEVKQNAKSQQNLIQKIMSTMGEIFAPIIPALIVGGLILGFRNVIDSMAIVEHLPLMDQRVQSACE